MQLPSIHFTHFISHMKHFRSEHAFEKYRPHLSWRQKVARFFRKKQYNAAPMAPPTHYKTNPFKQRKDVRTSKFKLILLIIVLSFWVACLAYTPYFRINKVTYSGLENNTEAELSNIIYPNHLNKKSWLPLNNYFFINANKVSADLYESFSFETVQVTKVFPNQLNIIIKEKISSVIYDNGKKYFLLDDRGVAIKYLADVDAGEVVIKVATSTSFSLLSTTSTTSTPIFATTTFEHVPNYEKIKKQFGSYPIVYDKRELEINLKQTDVLPAEHIAAVISWHRYLAQEGVERLKFFVLEDLNAGMEINTTDHWNIVFQPKSSTESQIITLKETLTQIKPKEYVDLRFGEKVYWK